MSNLKDKQKKEPSTFENAETQVTNTNTHTARSFY